MRDWSNYSNIMYIFSVSNLEFKFDYRTLPVHMKVSGSSTHSQPGFANWSLYIQIIASLDTMTETFSQLHAYVDICQFNIWNTGVVLIMQIYWIFENIFFSSEGNHCYSRAYQKQGEGAEWKETDGLTEGLT